MPHTSSLCIALAALAALAAAPVAAQVDHPAQPESRFGPRSFFPQEYTREVFVDVDALQDTALWDSLERAAFSGTMRLRFRQTFGFRVADLTSMRVASRWVKEEGSAGPFGARDVTVTVLQGRRLCLPPRPKADSTAYKVLEAQTIAGHEVVREGVNPAYRGGVPQEGTLYVMPRPDCLVIGNEGLVRPILEGKRRGGVIDSRVMALTAIRKPLAYFAAGFPRPDDPRYEREQLLHTNWVHEDDPVEQMVAQVIYDEKTENIEIAVTLRFANGKSGPKRLKEGVEGTIEALKQQPVYALMKSFFQRIRWRRDGLDLHVTLTIQPEDISGLLGGSGLVTWFMLGQAAAPPPVIAAPQPAAAAETAPRKVKDGQPLKVRKR